MPSLTDKQTEEICRKIDQIHQHTRQVISCLVGWFTFFVTVNYASMGWFAKSSQGETIKILITIIAVVFITQNVIAIFTCIEVRKYFLETHIQIIKYQTDLSSTEIEPTATQPQYSCVPIPLYSRAATFMTVALIPVIVAWCAFPFFIKT